MITTLTACVDLLCVLLVIQLTYVIKKIIMTVIRSPLLCAVVFISIHFYPFIIFVLGLIVMMRLRTIIFVRFFRIMIESFT